MHIVSCQSHFRRQKTPTHNDADGNAITIRDARSVVTQTTFDAYNRPIAVQAAMGSVDAVTTTTTFDANGNALSPTHGFTRSVQPGSPSRQPWSAASAESACPDAATGNAFGTGSF